MLKCDPVTTETPITSGKTNPHQGIAFDGFLKAEGANDAVHAKALKRALAEKCVQEMQSSV